MICHQVGEQARGAALGAAYGLLDLGQVFGPFAGALAASILPVEGAFLAIGGMLAVAGILATLTRRLPRDVGPVPAPPAPALIEVKS